MIRKSLHILLIAANLLSTTGLLVNKHFCLGQLQSMALFMDAKACYFATDQASPCEASAPQIKRKNCCSDESRFHQVDEEATLEPNKMPGQDQALSFVLLPARLPFDGLTAGEGLVRYRHYKPPLLVRNVAVDLQTFRC